MDKLPYEVLVHLLSYLSPSDRLNAALTCKRWAQAVSTSQLLKDVALTINDDDQLEAAEAFIKISIREHRNLKLRGVHLSEYNAEFWEKIGRNLRDMEFIDPCSSSPEVFAEILRKCSKLESLNLSGLDLESSGESCLEKVQGSFSSVRHLQPPRQLTGAIYTDLLRLMPNAASISLSVGFLGSSFDLSLFLTSLGANQVITELALLTTYPSAEDRIRLIRMCSATIEVLRAASWLASGEFFEAIGDCTMLRSLTIYGNNSFVDSQMEKILLNNPELEELELFICYGLTDEGLAPLHQLKKLRKLKFDQYEIRVTNEFVRSLGTIPSLQYFEFEFPMLTSAAIIASVPNLRALAVHGDRFTESDFAKLRKLTQLRSLRVISADQLTDLALERGLGSPALEHLELRNSPLTDIGLASIGAYHKRLRTLILVRCGNITAKGLTTLLQHTPHLEKLKIRDDDISIGGDFFRALERLCPRLRYLKLKVHSSIDDFSVESFRRKRPTVAVIMKHSCDFSCLVKGCNGAHVGSRNQITSEINWNPWFPSRQ